MQHLGLLGQAASSTTSPKGIAISVQQGDLIVVRAGGSSSNGALTISNSGTAISWTATSRTDSGYSPVYLWTGKALATGSLTITVTRSSGSSYYWARVSGWRGADVTGTPVSSIGSGTPTLGLTIAANSGVAWVSADYNSGSISNRGWLSVGGSPTEIYADTPSSTFYAADWGVISTAGAKTVGMSAPGSQKWSAIAVEIKATIVETQPEAPAPTAPNQADVLTGMLSSSDIIVPPSTTTPLPDLSYLTGARKPTLRYTAVNSLGVTLGPIDSIKRAGSLKLSQQAEIRASGSLDRAVINGAISNLIKIEYVLNEGEDDEHAWSWGVFLSASPRSTFGTPNNSAVEVYDRTSILSEDALEAPLFLPVGTVITDEVRRQITLSGGTNLAITQSTKALTTSLSFSPGDSRLKVVNTLLDAADYFAIWCDGQGAFRGEPYREPLERGIAWEFHDDEDSIVDPEWDLDDDTYAVPNKVIAISRTDGTDSPLVAWAAVTDTTSPYHFDNLGHWRADVLKDVEVTTLADLQKKADRRLREASKVSRTLTVDHAWVPLKINDVVHFDVNGITGHFVLINQSLPLDAQELVTSTFQEVNL